MHLDPLPTLSDHLCHEIITTPILTADQLPTGFFASTAFHINSNQTPTLSLSNQSIGSAFSLYSNGSNGSNGCKNRHLVQSSSAERVFPVRPTATGLEPNHNGREPKCLSDESGQASRINSIEEQPELEAEAVERQSVASSSVTITLATDECETPQSQQSQQQSVMLRNGGSRSHSPICYRHGIRTVQGNPFLYRKVTIN